jgi:hypothetical protein
MTHNLSNHNQTVYPHLHTHTHTHTPFSGAPATIMMINHESFANDLPQKLFEEMSSSKEILSSKLYCLGKSNINLLGKLMIY